MTGAIFMASGRVPNMLKILGILESVRFFHDEQRYRAAIEPKIRSKVNRHLRRPRPLEASLATAA
jgi:hypothetical protein